MVRFGKACQKFHDEVARNLKPAFIECDEMHSITYAKDVNLPDHLKGSLTHGDMWTFCGMCTDSRFMISWKIGKHHLASEVRQFTDDLASRIPGKVQIHTDQLWLYKAAFEGSFGKNADYATTRKSMSESKTSPDGQFIQPDYRAAETRIRSEMGDPNMDAVTTNHVERQNLTVRTWNRRQVRRTISHSKKPENANAHLALHYFYYNYCHQHASLEGSSPAMAMGVTDKLWSIRDIVNLVNN